LFLNSGSDSKWSASEGSTDFVRTRKLIRRKKFVATPPINKDKKLLYVDVIEGKDLPSMDFVGKSDPFCVLKVNGVAQQTHVIDNDANPVWKETLWFEVKNSDMITLECYDKDPVGQELIGRTDIAVSSITAEKDEWLHISNKSKKQCGQIHLKYHIAEVSP